MNKKNDTNYNFRNQCLVRDTCRDVTESQSRPFECVVFSLELTVDVEHFDADGNVIRTPQEASAVKVCLYFRRQWDRDKRCWKHKTPKAGNFRSLKLDFYTRKRQVTQNEALSESIIRKPFNVHSVRLVRLGRSNVLSLKQGSSSQSKRPGERTAKRNERRRRKREMKRKTLREISFVDLSWVTAFMCKEENTVTYLTISAIVFHDFLPPHEKQMHSTWAWYNRVWYVKHIVFFLCSKNSHGEIQNKKTVPSEEFSLFLV